MLGVINVQYMLSRMAPSISLVTCWVTIIVQVPTMYILPINRLLLISEYRLLFGTMKAYPNFLVICILICTLAPVQVIAFGKRPSHHSVYCIIVYNVYMQDNSIVENRIDRHSWRHCIVNYHNYDVWSKQTFTEEHSP